MYINITQKKSKPHLNIVVQQLLNKLHKTTTHTFFNLKHFTLWRIQICSYRWSSSFTYNHNTVGRTRTQVLYYSSHFTHFMFSLLTVLCWYFLQSYSHLSLHVIVDNHIGKLWIFIMESAQYYEVEVFVTLITPVYSMKEVHYIWNTNIRYTR